MKKLILVTSPPACGKTFVAKQLAAKLEHMVYLDKDTLLVLSHQIFKVAGEPINRSSEFFETHIRDYEYEAIVDLALEALEYEDIVLINAPFSREVRDLTYMANLRARVKEKGARLEIIWVVTEPEVCHQRMIKRNSERDTWKLKNWEKYLAQCDFSIPENLKCPQDGQELILFYNSSDEEFRQSLLDTVDKIRIDIS